MPSNRAYEVLNQLDQLAARAIEIEQIAHNLTVELVNIQQTIAEIERSNK